MALMLVAMAFISSFMQFRISEEEVNKRFETKGVAVEMNEYHLGPRKIRYYQTGFEQGEKKPLILFVHGAPGSSQDNLGFLENEELLKVFSMISVDRPGYGYSNFGHSMKSIEEQCRIIGKLLEDIDQERSVTLVGHSFGGPVVAGMASMFPEKVDNILMLAPALDPREEKFIGLARFSKIPPIRWLTPIAWKVAADEKTSHVDELWKMEPNWPDVRCKVVHMHGTKDSLVPYSNINITREKMTNARVEIISLEGADHFLPWSHAEQIREVLLSLID